MTSGSVSTTEEILRQLWDRQQISDVMLRFGRGLDLHDWDMYAETLTDPFSPTGTATTTTSGASRARASTSGRYCSSLKASPT